MECHNSQSMFTYKQMDDIYQVINVHEYIDGEEYLDVTLKTDNMIDFRVYLNDKELVFETGTIKFYNDNIGDDYILLSNDRFSKDFELLVERIVLKMKKFNDVPYALINDVLTKDGIKVYLHDRRKKMIADYFDKIKGIQFAFKFDVWMHDKPYTNDMPLYFVMLNMLHFQIIFQ